MPEWVLWASFWAVAGIGLLASYLLLSWLSWKAFREAIIRTGYRFFTLARPGLKRAERRRQADALSKHILDVVREKR